MVISAKMYHFKHEYEETSLPPILSNLAPPNYNKKIFNDRQSILQKSINWPKGIVIKIVGFAIRFDRVHIDFYT